MSGTDVCKQLRARSSVPVIMLTARDSEIDKVLGLELGADDYVTKPFSLRELLARCKAMLRRRARDERAAEQQFAIGESMVDLAAFTITKKGRAEALSPKEAAMLALLRREHGRAVSRARFLAEVWGGDQFVGDRTIDTHMLNLRAKVEADPKAPVHLLTVHGVGYRLVCDA
jgi:two-component system response regulator RegX3